MSCWRVLELSDRADHAQVPQLLVKPHFRSKAYTVFLTDLSNIWSEELDLDGIISRASEETSPIEVSKHDTSQLAILLDHVQKPLTSDHDSTCRIMQDHVDGLVLHAMISLPEPLDSLTWKFRLRKRAAVTLKDELILPLLVSSHIQRQRIHSLISIISEKDRAISRLVDQYESSNLDLAVAFPSISGLKSGRRFVKREQAAKHVTGLQPFHEEPWTKNTAELRDSNVSTLGLFQEVLSECTLKVPTELKSEDGSTTWWTAVDTTLHRTQAGLGSKSGTQSKTPPLPSKPTTAGFETDEDETEDEFETHENFKLRNASKQPPPVAKSPVNPAEKQVEGNSTNDDDDDEDDDDDLDAPTQYQSPFRSQQKVPSRIKSPAPSASKPSSLKSPSAPPSPLKRESSSLAQKPKGKGFRLGGRSRNVGSPPLSNDTQEKDTAIVAPATSSELNTEVHGVSADAKPARKGFRIGGRAKMCAQANTLESTTASKVETMNTSAVATGSAAGVQKPTLTVAEKTTTSAEEECEETAEEKAERKRGELKRKNEELAKRQAQSKKKKRF